MSSKHACDFCRRRKLKCSREEPTCSKCIQFDKECVYSSRPKREPITKAQVKNLEYRIKTLEELLLQFVNTRENLELLLEIVNNRAEERTNDNGVEVSEISDDPLFSELALLSTVPLTVDDFLLFQDSRKLQWQEYDLEESEGDNERNQNLLKYYENPSDIIDGMVALNLRNTTANLGNTFHGISSSNGFLRFLSGPKNLKVNGHNTKNYYYSTMKPLFNENNIRLLQSDNSDVLLNDPNFMDDLIKSYFEIYHKAYPFIRKHEFFNQYEQFKRQQDNTSTQSTKYLSFQVILNTILATGAFFKLGESSIIDLLYYKRVRKFLQRLNLMECGNYQLLEAIIILGNYLQKRNKPNTCWNYHGLAFRMAIGFGLHKEVHRIEREAFMDSKIQEDLESRRRLWWGLFFFDTGLSVTFGRPLHSPSFESFDTRLPLNINEIDLQGLKANQNISTIVKNYPTIHSSLIQEAILSKVSCKIYSFITKVSGATQNPISGMLWANNLNKHIINFTNSVPEYYKENDEMVTKHLHEICPPEWFKINLDGSLSIPKWFSIGRRRLIWRYKNMQILLFRNFICESSQYCERGNSFFACYSTPIAKKLLGGCINICHKAASETISSVTAFIDSCELDTLSSWYATYFNFQAVLIPILLLHMIPNVEFSEGNIDEYLEEIKSSIVNLRVLLKYNNSAANLVNTIQSLTDPLIEKFSHYENSRDVSNSDTENFPLALSLFSGVYFDLQGLNESQFKSMDIANENRDQVSNDAPNELMENIGNANLNTEIENENVINDFLQNDFWNSPDRSYLEFHQLM